MSFFLKNRKNAEAYKHKQAFGLCARMLQRNFAQLAFNMGVNGKRPFFGVLPLNLPCICPPCFAYIAGKETVILFSWKPCGAH